MTKKHDGAGDYVSGYMEDFTFSNGDFTIDISGRKVTRKQVTPEGEWLSITISRKAGITSLNSQERIDGVLYLVVETRDKKGIRQKQYTRADLVKG